MKFNLLNLVVVTIVLLGNLALADDPNYLYANAELQYQASTVDFPFDPNDYSFLIYDTRGSEENIKDAMDKWGLSYTLRNSDAGNHVTLNDLQNHDILIVGWNAGGNTFGVNAAVLEAGINGRIILSGHDADYHTVKGPDGAEKFLMQAIDYVLAGNGTGLITLGDSTSPPFAYLPSSWGITRTGNGGEEVSSFTSDGSASGVYDGLIPYDASGNEDIRMSPWGTAFHNTFTAMGDGFKEFELDQNDDAITIAAPINAYGFPFTKDDGLDDETECASPEAEITYEICFNNTTDQTLYDCIIIDYLPLEVDYPAGVDQYVFDGNSIQLLEGDLNYNDEGHYYIWEIGTIAPYDANCVYLPVTVNYKAEPGRKIHNIAELWADGGDTFVARATEDTRVCCWGDPNIIYVDQTATGLNNGTNWYDAYTDLADALARAAESKCTDTVDIYVAQGTYDPNNAPGYGFVLPDGCAMYGGFKSGGCDFSQRNSKKYRTTLAGLINEQSITYEVVTMGDETLLDGFTVTNAFEQAVYGNGANFTISQCTIQESFGHGIYALNGDVDVQWCTVKLNDADGIRHEGAGYDLSVNNSWILRNGECGIYCYNSTPQLRNNIISESDLTRQGRAGIRLYRPAYSPVLHNLTVSNNKAEGIFFTDNGDVTGDPNNLDYPDLQNSIVYYNNPGGSQLAGFNADTIANFCCIQDCNEPDTTNYNSEPGFAYVVDPNGAPDPNNYHLAYNAFCIDKANPYLSYTNQVDIDGEGLDRKYGDYVDIGADEVYDCSDEILTDIDVHNDLDRDADGIVNYAEFAPFSAAWLSRDPNDPSLPTDPNLIDPNDFVGWSPSCNYDATGQSAYTIDMADLDVFLDSWLWVACWKLEEIEAAAAQSQSQSMMMQPLSMMTMETLTIESEPEPSLDTLVQIVGFLDEIVATEQPDNIENIQELRTYLMDEIWVIWSRQNE